MSKAQPSVYQSASSDEVKLVSYKHLQKNKALKNRYKGWLNDKRNLALIGSKELNEKIYTDVDIDLGFKRFTSSYCHGFFIHCEKLKMYIGTVKLDKIDWCEKTAEDGILIGENCCHGQGYGTIAYNIILDYAFNMLDLNTIRGGCNEYNHGMRKIFEKLGYKQTDIAKRVDFINNQWSNHIYFEIGKKEFKPMTK